MCNICRLKMAVFEVEFFCTLFMHRFLETPMNKGLLEFSKNYEFDGGCTNTVPKLFGDLVGILKNH